MKEILAHENPKHVERFAQRIFSHSERLDFWARHDEVTQQKETLCLRISETHKVANRACDKYDRALWKVPGWVAGR